MMQNSQVSDQEYQEIVHSLPPYDGLSRSKPHRIQQKKNQKIEQRENIKNKIKDYSKHSIHETIDFSDKGFDIPKSIDSLQKIQSLFEEIRNFSKMPNGHLSGFSWAELCREIAEYSHEPLYLIKKGKKHYLATQKPLIKQISQEDAMIWTGVSEILQKMKMGLSGPGLEGLINDQLCQSEKIIMRTRQSIQKYEGKYEVNQIEKLYQQYLEVLAIKTFKQGLDTNPIDQLNYFRYKEFEQGHSSFYRSMDNIQQWKNYITKRRNKLRKSELHILHVACQSCLSPHFQSTNPLIACPECHTRYHQLCLDLSQSKRCGRCVYSRLSNQLKSTIPECFMCGVTGLGTLKIASNRFAHIFCLISHQLWQISNRTIDITKKPILKSTQKLECIICKKSTGFIYGCRLCLCPVHPICAFLRGYSIQMDDSQKLWIECCSLQPKEMSRIESQRKFILNYQKYVFKLEKPKVSEQKQEKQREKTEKQQMELKGKND